MVNLWIICHSSSSLVNCKIRKAGRSQLQEFMRISVINEIIVSKYTFFNSLIVQCSNIFGTLFLFPKSSIHEPKSMCGYAKRPRDWLSNLSSAQSPPCPSQFQNCLYFYLVPRLYEADLEWQRDGKKTKKKTLRDDCARHLVLNFQRYH